MRKIVTTPDAPSAIGPYSQGVVSSATKLLFTAGQIALNPQSGDMIGGDIKEQTQRVLENLKAVIEAEGATLRDVIKTTIFMTDLNEFSAMNEVYARYFDQDPPARTTVGVKQLPKNARIEIEAVVQIEG